MNPELRLVLESKMRAALEADEESDDPSGWTVTEICADVAARSVADVCAEIADRFEKADLDFLRALAGNQWNLEDEDTLHSIADRIESVWQDGPVKKWDVCLSFDMTPGETRTHHNLCGLQKGHGGDHECDKYRWTSNNPNPASNLQPTTDPLSEILHLLGFERASERVHDATVPDHEPGKGRG